MSMTRHATTALTVALGIGLACTAQPARADDWSFSVTPYLWGAGQSGTVGLLPGLPSVNIDLSFGDIFEDLDAAIMVVGRAQRDRFAITVDMEYIHTTTDGDTPGTSYGAGEVKTKTSLATVLAGYQLASSSEGELWGDAGVRYWDVENKLKLEPGTQPGVNIKGSGHWFDPILGIRGKYDLSSNWTLRGWGYLGGFGAGSDLLADLFAGVSYAFTDHVALTGGWRYLSVDRTDGAFVYDVVQTGPILGLSITF